MIKMGNKNNNNNRIKLLKDNRPRNLSIYQAHQKIYNFYINKK